MGAMAFVLLMIILLFVGIGSTFLGIILFCMQKTERKRQNKIPALKAISIIIIVFGIIACLIPVGYFLFIRISNGLVDENYVNTGITVTWGKEDTFVYENVTYVPVNYNHDIFEYYANYEAEMKPAFNIQTEPDLWGKLFNAYDRDVMYRVKNGTGETLYYNGDLYCAEKVVDKVEKYYADDENYDWYIYDEERGKDSAIELTDDEIDFLYNMNMIDSEKSVLVDDEFRCVFLVKRSCDDAVEAFISLCYDGEEWGWDTGIENENLETEEFFADYVYDLPDTMNDKIEKALSNIEK